MTPSRDGDATARRVAVSTGSQLGARSIHLVLNVVSTVAVIRYLGPIKFGDYNKVITVTGWMGLVAEFGLMKLAVREATRERERAGSIVGTVVVTRLALSLGAALCAQLVLFAIGASPTVLVAAGVASMMFVTEALLSTIVVFHVELRQQYEAVIRVAMEVVEISVLIGVIVSGGGIVLLFAAPVVGGLVGAAVAWAAARRRFGLRLEFDRSLVRALLRLAAPIVPAVLIGVLTVKLDNFMVAAMRSREESGLYGAAYQPIEYAFLAITVVCYPFFPVLVRHQGKDQARFRAVFQRGTEALLAFVLPVPFLLAAVALPAVHAVYRGEFDGSALPLQLLSVALVFMAVSAWHGFVLLAGDRQRLTVRYGAVALTVSLVACLVLVPTVGYRGAAWAAIAANVLSTVWSGVLVRRELGVVAAPLRVARVVAAAAALLAVAAVLRHAGVPWWGAAAVALLTYPGWLVATGVIDRELVAAVRARSAAQPAAPPVDAVAPAMSSSPDFSREVAPMSAGPDADLPFISVIAPTYNRSDVVETTLRHLCAQDYPADRYEVILVDNSSDETPQMAQRVAVEAPMPVRLVWVDERLPAVKRNIGLRAARGDLVMFINDDVWFAPDALRRHAAAHAAHEGPVAVLGHVYQSPRMEQTAFVRAYQPFAYAELAGRDGEQLSYRYFWSMNLSLPRATMIERNLLFHEDWAEIGHEDVELGYRWTEAGLPLVYAERATGEHFHPHTLASACRLQESVGRGMRDLEWLIPDPALHERYGVFRWHNSSRAVLRGLARRTLFNAVTVPAVKLWLDGGEADTALARWCYWKVLLHHTNRGYRAAPPRRPARRVTFPAGRRDEIRLPA